MEELLYIYNNILNEYGNLKTQGSITIDNYKSLSNSYINLLKDYNLIIEEKNNYKKISDKLIDDKRNDLIHQYKVLLNQVVDMIKEYNIIIEEKDNYKKSIDTVILDLFSEYNDISMDVYDYYNNKINNILNKYNLITNSIIIIVKEYRLLKNYTNNILTENTYNYYYNKINNILNQYNLLVNSYNNKIISDLLLLTIEYNKVANLITFLNKRIEYYLDIYSIKTFSIILNTFLKNFNNTDLKLKKSKLIYIQEKYLQFLMNIKNLNNKSISLIHPLYLTPLRLTLNSSEDLILVKYNIIIDLSNYYGSISPDRIEYTKINISNNRDSIKKIEIIDEFNFKNRISDYIYGNKLIIKPDYRNIDYIITLKVKTIFESKLNFTFNT